jgi:two-component response regulator (ARR-A family)
MGMAAESQFHVLAVDDSLFDRKLIERLLQKSSCQGINVCYKKKVSIFV